MKSEKRRRNTPQRRVIHEELCAVTSHPTAAELFEIVRKRLPRISLGTVYRNLEVLHQDGKILKLEMAGSEARFDGDTRLHHHILCTKCEIVRDVEVDRPLEPANTVCDDAGFEIQGYKLKFLGLCPACRTKAAGPGANPIH